MPNSITGIGTGKPLRAGSAISRRDFNATRGAIRGARGENGIRVELSRRGMVIHGAASAGLSLSSFDFGWAGSSGQTVTIASGYVLGFTGIVEATEAVVDVGGTPEVPHLIVVEGTIAGPTAAIRTVSIPKTEFTGHVGTTFCWPLYTVFVRNGKPVRSKIHHVGVINLKAWVAP